MMHFSISYSLHFIWLKTIEEFHWERKKLYENPSISLSNREQSASERLKERCCVIVSLILLSTQLCMFHMGKTHWTNRFLFLNWVLCFLISSSSASCLLVNSLACCLVNCERSSQTYYCHLNNKMCDNLCKQIHRSTLEHSFSPFRYEKFAMKKKEW